MPSRSLADRYPNLIPVGGHPAVDMPEHVVEAARLAAARPSYAPTLGAPALREAIAERLSVELGHPIDPQRNLIVTIGGMQALYLAALASGERAVVHAPSFFFPQLVRAAGGRCVATGGEGGPPDWDAFAAAIDGETTLAIVNTPVNPTGYVLREADLDAVASAVAGSGCVVLSDEAYAGVLYDGLEHRSPASHPELRERTLVVRSFSKTHAMAAWRVGYAAGPAETIERMAQAMGWQALAVDGVAQAAAHAALTGPQGWLEEARAELAEMRPRAIAAANEAGLRAELPEAAAFIWASVDGEEDAWSDRLAREHGITAVPGRHFHARAPHLRIPFGGRPDARARLLAELARI